MTLLSDTKTELTLVTSEYSCTESVQILRCHHCTRIYLSKPKEGKSKQLQQFVNFEKKLSKKKSFMQSMVKGDPLSKILEKECVFKNNSRIIKSF